MGKGEMGEKKRKKKMQDLVAERICPSSAKIIQACKHSLHLQ